MRKAVTRLIKLSENEWSAIKTLITERTNYAILNLKDTNPRYVDVYKRQEKRWETVVEILNKLSKEDRRTVTSYYDDEVHRFGFEFDAVYMQGIWDGIKALMFFGIIGTGSGSKQ